MPQISVIVPVYNVEKYLHRCVDSILAQTFTDFELILVDDGSPDKCGAICDEYARKDARIRVIHKKNGGVSSARNAALDATQGEYIAFCDSDDYWDSSYLEKTIAAFSDETVDCVVVNYAAINDEGVVAKTSEHQAGFVNTAHSDARFSYILHELLTQSHGWEIWTRVFRASIIKEHDIRFCTDCGNYAEDLGFCLEYAIYARKVFSLRDVLYYYVWHNDSMMRNSASVIKLNSLNQVSYQVAKRYHGEMQDELEGKNYPIIHFVLMSTEIRRMIWAEKYRDLGEEFRKVEKLDWCQKQLKSLRLCTKVFEEQFGRRERQRAFLLLHYCFHKNWALYRYESAIAYRWFIEKE